MGFLGRFPSQNDPDNTGKLSVTFPILARFHHQTGLRRGAQKNKGKAPNGPTDRNGGVCDRR